MASPLTNQAPWDNHAFPHSPIKPFIMAASFIPSVSNTQNYREISKKSLSPYTITLDGDVIPTAPTKSRISIIVATKSERADFINISFVGTDTVPLICPLLNSTSRRESTSVTLPCSTRAFTSSANRVNTSQTKCLRWEPVFMFNIMSLHP